MNKEQGFSSIFILLGIVGALIMGGGAYYLGTLNNKPHPLPSPTIQPTVAVAPITKEQTPSSETSFCSKISGFCIQIPSNWKTKETETGQNGGIPTVLLSCLESKDDSYVFDISKLGKPDNIEDILYCQGSICDKSFFTKREDTKVNNKDYIIMYAREGKDLLQRDIYTIKNDSLWKIRTGRNSSICNKEDAEKVLQRILETFQPI